MNLIQTRNFIAQPKSDATKELLMKRVPRSYVKPLNRIFKRHRTIQFKIENDDYIIQFIPLTPYQIKQEKICVRINNHFLFHLNLDVEFSRNVLTDYFDMGNLSQMPTILREIAVEVALERLLNRFDHHFNCKSSIIPLSDTRWSDKMKYKLSFVIIKRTDRTKFYGSIKTNHSSIDWIVKHLDRLAEIRFKDAGQIPLDIFFETGRAILSIQELNDIEPNDIIIMDSDLSLNNLPIIIRAESLKLFMGSLDSDDKIKIEEIVTDNMEEKMKVTPAANQTIPTNNCDKQIDNIPVKLVFQLGETQMKFGELTRLQPGYIFTVAADIKKPVTIKANGRPIGIGELVQIGDSVGVRVLKFEDY